GAGRTFVPDVDVADRSGREERPKARGLRPDRGGAGTGRQRVGRERRRTDALQADWMVAEVCGCVISTAAHASSMRRRTWRFRRVRAQAEVVLAGGGRAAFSLADGRAVHRGHRGRAPRTGATAPWRADAGDRLWRGCESRSSPARAGGSRPVRRGLLSCESPLRTRGNRSARRERRRGVLAVPE